MHPNAPATVRAHAKIVGPDWIHYMLKPQCVMGRGPSGVDLALTGDPSISRKHVQISFSPEVQAFEISVLGKNGIFVSGDFLRKDEQPKLLRSHTDIIIGRKNPSLVTFYLPCLPSGIANANSSTNTNGSAAANAKPADAMPNMVTMVGTLLIASELPLTAAEIFERLIHTRVRLLETLGSKEAIRASIRSAIQGNPHMFETVSAYELAKLTGATADPPAAAGFKVHQEHKLRFLKATVNEAHGNNTKGAASAKYAAIQRTLDNNANGR